MSHSVRTPPSWSWNAKLSNGHDKWDNKLDNEMFISMESGIATIVETDKGLWRQCLSLGQKLAGPR